MTTRFTFQPASFIPFQDLEAVKRARAIKKQDMTKHPNPDFRIQIIPDADVEWLWIMDMFRRVKQAADEDRQFVIIAPNPWPAYAKVARLLNQFRVNCRKLVTFNMDEYANERGDIAPESWPLGFGHAFKKFFYSELDPKLRPPEKQIHLLANATIKDYGKRLADLGGADICYSGPGWTGHIAFVEPDAPEFAAPSLEEWKKMGPRVCTLSSLTICQNSLHGCFGASGDLWAVPPKAATIGPAEVVGAKARLDLHSIAVGGSFNSWQRLTTRLCLHGPVSPRMPGSLLQTLPTEVWVSESAAADIETRWDVGY